VPLVARDDVGATRARARQRVRGGLRAAPLERRRRGRAARSVPRSPPTRSTSGSASASGLDAAADARDDALAELAATYAAAPVGLCVVDRQLRWVRINERLAEINGVPVEAHLGRRVRDVLPAQADDLEPALRHVLETGEALRDVEVVSGAAAERAGRRVWLAQFHPLRDCRRRRGRA
jgi:PAS domain-containing protein